MATINTQEGQSIFDLAIQHYGSIENLFDIVSKFSDINTTITAGTPIEIIENSNNIAKYYVTNKDSVATKGGLLTNIYSFVYSVTVTAAQTISLPMISTDDSLYQFTVDFGDDEGQRSVGAYTDTDRQHTYVNAGTYDITINGLFDYIKFVDSPTSLIEIKQFGQSGIGDSSFLNCVNFTTISATDYPTINNNSLANCFKGCTTFNDSISMLVTIGVTDMSGMFYGATIFNQPVSTLSTLLTTNMSQMFRGTSVFNQDMSAFYVGKCINMAEMFLGAGVFNKDLDGWDVSLVTNMREMFSNAEAFSGDITSWNTGNCVDMSLMFAMDVAGVFNDDLGAWDVTSLATAEEMFRGLTLSTLNYDSILVGWEAQSVLNGVDLHGGGSTYTGAGAGGTARAALIADHSWSITDGGAV